MQKSTFTLLLLLPFFLSAQTTRPSHQAVFQEIKPVLDGQLTDSCWQALSPLGPFTTSTPVFGQTPHCRTEVRLFYAESALYVAARCFDPDAGGVRDDGGIRDGLTTGDWFRISLDTWDDDRLSFDFAVTAAGVQLDSRLFYGSWDAIWQSAVAPQAEGWTVEIRIPYTALRFPQKAEQRWGLQLTRYDRSSGETSTWSPQDPLVGDQVLQYGALSGLRDLHQQRRKSLALHSESQLETAYKPFEVRGLSETLGLDGKLGLNSSTTLDFTILPQRQVQVDFASVLSPAGTSFSDQGDLPAPRQFQAEEADLFYKANVNDQPYVSAGPLLWRLPTLSGTAFRSFSNSKVLQATKLSTRTEGNWRFGVYNALLGPVKVDTINTLTLESGSATLQSLSNYNHLTAEYLLPNNSYINISTATVLAGPGYTFVTPHLDFSVRDRSNSYEVSGSVNMPFKHFHQNDYLSYQYGLNLARVNRRWGWRLSHFQSNRYLKAPEGTPEYRNDWSQASLFYQDYRPHGPFLNRFGDIGVVVQQIDNLENPSSWSIRGSFSALDRGFRRYGLFWQTTPYFRDIRFTDRVRYVKLKVAPSISGGINYSSDSRKRFNIQAGLSGSVSTYGEFPSIQASVSPVWVLHRRLMLNGSLQGNAHFESLTLLSTPGRWIFEQHDSWTTFGQLSLNWFLSPRMRVWGGVHFFHLKDKNRKALELTPDGQLVSVDWPLAGDGTNLGNGTNYSLGFQWFFSPISQLRFQYAHGPSGVFRIGPSGFGYEAVQYGDTNLSLIYFLNGTKER